MLKFEIGGYRFSLRMPTVGEVLEVGDASTSGLRLLGLCTESLCDAQDNMVAVADLPIHVGLAAGERIYTEIGARVPKSGS